MNHQELVVYCQERMEKGSKSFALAAKIFPTDIYQDVLLLYSWCRYVDDVIDGQELGMDQGQTAHYSTFIELKDKTIKAYSESSSDPIFQGFHYVMNKYQIPLQYPLDLLEGMNWDAQAREVLNQEDLIKYCYHVAGVVGLMMTKIMGVSSDKAFAHAMNMGHGMQLTNIARDIVEDAKVGRCYIPTEWLQEFHLKKEDLSNPKYQSEIKTLSDRILSLAEVCYQNADQGLQYLNFRSAFTVASARWIYWKIGYKIKRSKIYSFESRISTSKAEKFRLIFKALVQTLKSRTH